VTRENYNRSGDQNEKLIYEKERKNYKRILQREKRGFLNGILQEAEKNRSQGNIRNFFKNIKKYMSFNPSLKAVKSSVGTILMEPKKKIIRWKEYFFNLLNGIIPAVDLASGAIGK